MSALLQFAFLRQAGGIPTTDGTLAPDHFANGLPFEANNSLAIDDQGAVDHYWQGLGFTSTGRLATFQNGTVDHYSMGAAPMTSAGQLCTRNAGPLQTEFVNGIRYRSLIRVSIT